MLGTKQGIANSYNSPDSINELDWRRKLIYKDVFNYYKGLIDLRKHHPAFRMPSTKMIQQNLEFLKTNNNLLIGYILKNHANLDKWKNIIVLFNANNTIGQVDLPKGNWTIAVNGETINESGIGDLHDVISLNSTSAYVLFQ
jgi:pullulanase